MRTESVYKVQSSWYITARGIEAKNLLATPLAHTTRRAARWTKFGPDIPIYNSKANRIRFCSPAPSYYRCHLSYNWLFGLDIIRSFILHWDGDLHECQVQIDRHYVRLEFDSTTHKDLGAVSSARFPWERLWWWASLICTDSSQLVCSIAIFPGKINRKSHRS